METTPRTDRWNARSLLPPPLPGPAPLCQAWADVVFVHWRVEPEAVAHLLPPGTSPDTLNAA